MALTNEDREGIVSHLKYGSGDMSDYHNWDEIKNDVQKEFPELIYLADQKMIIDILIQAVATKVDDSISY